MGKLGEVTGLVCSEGIDCVLCCVNLGSFFERIMKSCASVPPGSSDLLLGLCVLFSHVTHL